MKEAIEIKELCRRYNVPFVINDNVDIALEMDADGVHVGQSDMEALDVRAKLGPDKIIGVSAQTVEQAILAEKHGADYFRSRRSFFQPAQKMMQKKLLWNIESNMSGSKILL